MGNVLVPTEQQAGKITNIEQVHNFHQTNNILLLNNGRSAGRFSQDYYNLIVRGNEPFLDQGHVTMPRDRVFKHSADHLKAWLSPLTPEVIETLKTFPCIICNEYDRTDSSQAARLAIITDIKMRSNGVEIYFHSLYSLPQKKLIELIYELGVNGNPRWNEFNTTHWTVKEIDLMEVLEENGLKLF